MSNNAVLENLPQNRDNFLDNFLWNFMRQKNWDKLSVNIFHNRTNSSASSVNTNYYTVDASDGWSMYHSLV